MATKTQGDIQSFIRNWGGRVRKNKSWFYRGEPENQIEYAFGQHFSFLKSVVPVGKGDKVLEVGCGRGSFGAFFADFGCRVTLTDLSEDILNEAKRIFKYWKLDRRAEFLVSDAADLKLANNTYDLTTSIGLLEHFKDPTDVIAEQMRVLKKGGVFTAYVVPKKLTMTTLIKPFNDMLRKNTLLFAPQRRMQKKVPLFRTTYDSAFYRKIVKKLGLKGIGASGVYPYPAVSFSPEFPFSVMPDYFERALVNVFKNMEKLRSGTVLTHGPAMNPLPRDFLSGEGNHDEDAF